MRLDKFVQGKDVGPFNADYSYLSFIGIVACSYPLEQKYIDVLRATDTEWNVNGVNLLPARFLAHRVLCS